MARVGTYVAAQGTGGTEANRQVTFSDVGSGNLLVVCASTYKDLAVDTISIADNKAGANTWTQVTNLAYDPVNKANLLVWYSDNSTSGSTTVTLSSSGTEASTYYTVVGIEYDGIAATSALDQSNTSTGSGPSGSSGSITATVDNSLVIAALTHYNSNDETLTPVGADFTNVYEYETSSVNMPFSIQEKFISSTSTEEETWTISQTVGWAGTILNFGIASLTTTGSPGAYTYTGTNVELREYGDAAMVVAPGAFNYSGTNAAVFDPFLAPTLNASSGSYTYAGTDTALYHDIITESAYGAFIFVGTNAQLTIDVTPSYILTVSPGNYTFYGSAILSNLIVASGAYTYSGTNANIQIEYGITAASGAYTYSGTASTLTVTTPSVPPAPSVTGGNGRVRMRGRNRLRRH